MGGDGATLVDFVHPVYGQFPLMLGLIGVARFPTPDGGAGVDHLEMPAPPIPVT